MFEIDKKYPDTKLQDFFINYVKSFIKHVSEAEKTNSAYATVSGVCLSLNITQIPIHLIEYILLLNPNYQ